MAVFLTSKQKNAMKYLFIQKYQSLQLHQKYIWQIFRTGTSEVYYGKGTDNESSSIHAIIESIYGFDNNVFICDHHGPIMRLQPDTNQFNIMLKILHYLRYVMCKFVQLNAISIRRALKHYTQPPCRYINKNNNSETVMIYFEEKAESDEFIQQPREMMIFYPSGDTIVTHANVDKMVCLYCIFLIHLLSI